MSQELGVGKSAIAKMIKDIKRDQFVHLEGGTYLFHEGGDYTQYWSGACLGMVKARQAGFGFLVAFFTLSSG